MKEMNPKELIVPWYTCYVPGTQQKNIAAAVIFSVVNRPSFETAAQLIPAIQKAIPTSTIRLIGTQTEQRSALQRHSSGKLSYPFGILGQDILLRILALLTTKDVCNLAVTCSSLLPITLQPPFLTQRNIEGPVVSTDEIIKLATEIKCKWFEISYFQTKDLVKLEENKENCSIL